MRNLLSAVLAVTLLGALGCESCWETRDPSHQAAAPVTPPPSEPPSAGSPPPAGSPAPQPTLATSQPTPPPQDPAAQRELESRRDEASPLRRFEPRQLRLGGQRVMAKPSVKFRPLRERPAPAVTLDRSATPASQP